jgi:hypothetical protein
VVADVNLSLSNPACAELERRQRIRVTWLIVEIRRYLCSQLATLTIEGQAHGVNIEEIWETGVALECETPVVADVPASISAEGVAFEGRVSNVRQDELGWRVEIEFSPETPWSPVQWRPDHLLDPAALKRG